MKSLLRNVFGVAAMFLTACPGAMCDQDAQMVVGRQATCGVPGGADTVQCTFEMDQVSCAVTCGQITGQIENFMPNDGGQNSPQPHVPTGDIVTASGVTYHCYF